jgi:hypothetical protein
VPSAASNGTATSAAPSAAPTATAAATAAAGNATITTAAPTTTPTAPTTAPTASPTASPLTAAQVLQKDPNVVAAAARMKAAAAKAAVSLELCRWAEQAVEVNASSNRVSSNGNIFQAQAAPDSVMDHWAAARHECLSHELAWSSQWQNLELPYYGKVDTYDGSGYSVDLPVNGTEAAAVLGRLKRNRFLDLSTRLLVCEYTVYNANLRLYLAVRYSFEFPGSGGVVVDEQHRPVRLELYPDTQGEFSRGLLVFLEAAMALGVVGYIADLVRKIIRDGFLTFLGGVWNMIEMVNLVLLITVVSMRLFFVDLMYGFSGKLPLFERPTPLAYTSMQSIASYEEAERLLLSLSAGVLMFRVFKYHVLFPQISFLLRMLTATTSELRAFMGLLTVLIVGFAQAGYTAFSTEDGSFRTFGRSLLTLFRGMTSGLDVDGVLEARPAMGQVFACLFLVTISLVVVNVFIAVLNDGYQNQKMKDELELDEVQVLVGNAHADAAAQIMGDFFEWGVVPIYRWMKRRIWLLGHAERAALKVSRGVGEAMADPDRKTRSVSVMAS